MNSEFPVSSIMTQKLVTVEATAHLSKIRQIFENYPFHHIPVMDEDRLVGIISKSDFHRVSYTISFTLDGTENISENAHIFTARDLMTRYPMQLHPDDTIGLAADIFLANRFHALPVVDGDNLMGIVTAHDLIAFAFGDMVTNEALVEDFNDI